MALTSPASSDNKQQAFILQQNLAALQRARDNALAQFNQTTPPIPETLVKKEILGAAINEIMRQHPALKEKIMARLEATWQPMKTQKTLTLMRLPYHSRPACLRSLMISSPHFVPALHHHSGDAGHSGWLTPPHKSTKAVNIVTPSCKTKYGDGFL